MNSGRFSDHSSANLKPAAATYSSVVSGNDCS